MSSVYGLNVTCQNQIGFHPFRRLNACYVKSIDRSPKADEKLNFLHSYNLAENIKTLDISTEPNEPGIDHIPVEVFETFVNLETLRINSKVSTIRIDNFDKFSHLTELVLSNQLESIPRAIFPANNRLVFLSFGSNRISNIDDSAFEHLNQLFGLKLQQNNLEEIKKETFSGLSALHVLNLNRNRIRRIQDGAFETLCALQFLHLQNNQLETLTEGIFRGLRNLTDISISNNRLHHIYNSLQHLRNVKKIDLNDNHIVDLDLIEFAKLPALIDLRLISSGFSFKLSENLPTMTSSPLEYLYLDQNNLSNPMDLRTLYMFGELKELSLDYNLYNDFNLGDKKLIEILPKLMYISLDGTNIDEYNISRIAAELKNDAITLH